MAVDENGNEIIQTTSQTEVSKENRSEERIKQLSDKVELTSKERDEKNALLESSNRERDFYKGYADIVSTQPAAKDHQEEIKEKVLKGYSVQDATFAVLGAAGKIGGNQPTASPQVAGGSASTTVTQSSDKPVAEMTQAERRERLAKELAFS